MSVVWLLIGALLAMLAMILLNKPTPPIVSPPAPTAPMQQQAPQPLVTKPSSIPNKVVDIQSGAEATEFLKAGGLLMVYAPWCGHCKTMMPALEEASNAPNTRVARFEGGKDPKFMAEQGIRGFPTLLTTGTGEGEFPKFSGGRDLQSLIQASTV
jgi:thiol-disulfide isomerase/thioredoxin